MKLITLHDHNNTSQEVVIDADAITSITPFGSGSAIQSGSGLVAVHETPQEVTEIIRNS